MSWPLLMLWCVMLEWGLDVIPAKLDIKIAALLLEMLLLGLLTTLAFGIGGGSFLLFTAARQVWSGIKAALQPV